VSLRISPEYEKLLPRMSEEEFAQLKTSIQEEGQHYPIIANEDLVVLDGHHRFRACSELGIEPDFEVRKFEEKILEKKFVIEANLRRRHLNNFQLVELAVPLLEIERTLAKRRKVEGGKIGRNIQLGLASDDALPEFKAKATEVLAKKVGLSARTFERGKKIMEKASEDDKQRLREGKASIARVYQEVVAPKNEGTNILEESAIMNSAENPRSIKNKEALTTLLKSLKEKNVFCPVCENNMFECTKCHKTLQESIRK
jgi:ParB-like chromosome segregation protein Spo0J